ncbi:MAG: hypothetical protein WA294_04520 [Acidobacteriaceae bacterium]
MPKLRNKTNPIFSIVFSKGTADKHRLPLAHVLETLGEIAKMIREVGIQVQRANGVESPDGDFGIELLAGETGGAFFASSVKANAEVTRDVKNGLETINRIFKVTDTVEKKTVHGVDNFGEPVLRRLALVGKIQEKDRTELKMELVSGNRKSKETHFSAVGAAAIREMNAAELAIESLTLYGKLQRLADFSETDEGHYFWGQIREDGGKVWRVRFSKADLPKVQKLFTKQVMVSGNAAYFKTRSPKLIASQMSEEKPRNFMAALERLQRNYGKLFGEEGSQAILDDLRG